MTEKLSSDKKTEYRTVSMHGGDLQQAAERGDADRILEYIKAGFHINFQNPNTGETALHIVAACQARKALRVLLNSGKCNFLVRDDQGRLASEMAYLYGHDPAVARLLGIKERKQAAEQGIKLTRRESIKL